MTLDQSHFLLFWQELVEEMDFVLDQVKDWKAAVPGVVQLFPWVAVGLLYKRHQDNIITMFRNSKQLLCLM